MATIWTIYNNYSLGVVAEATPFEFQFPVNDQDVTFSVITGALPTGIRIDGGYLRGNPTQVPRLTTYKFVIRAQLAGQISDRTFTMQIAGPDVPKWVSSAGDLPVGPQQTYFVLDESYIDFQLIANDEDTSTGQKLRFWIPSDGGLLPPGVVLSDTGRLYGWIKPLLIAAKPRKTGFYGTTLYDSDGYDYGIPNIEAYDSFGYDSYVFDYASEFIKPTKYNRKYEFTVIATDGDTSVRRKFSIYVIGDTITADTINIFSDEWPITVDNASVREPVWKTSPDLGVFRASNYFTHALDIFETADKTPVTYFLNSTNPDTTISLLPPGVQLDNITADLFGVIPYQPAITKTYTFTITAVRLGHLQKISAELLPGDLPLLIDNSSVIYRNNSMEGTEISRVYSSLYYVSKTTGILLTGEDDGHGIYTWTYHNLDTRVLLYFKVNDDVNSEYPWEEASWYLDHSLTNPATGHPLITSMNTGNSVFTDSYETAQSSRTFTLTVIGEIDSFITWITPTNLGVIDVEQVSTLSIHAISSLNDVLVYEILDPDTKSPLELLPYGLTLSSYGNIIGKVSQFTDETGTGLTAFHEEDVDGNSLYYNIFDDGNTTFDREFRIEVTAFNNAKTTSSSRIFTLTALTPNDRLFCDIRCVPFLPTMQRDIYQKFISDRDIFEYNAIFRQEDPNFGIRTDLSMLVYAGAEIQSLQTFNRLITKRKRFKFGDVKVAYARVTGTETVIYEVIYVEMIDPLENSTGHLPTVITTSDQLDPITIDDGVLSRGEYNGSVIYYPDDIVQYQGGLYQAITVTDGNIPTESEFFRKYSSDISSIDNATIFIDDPYSNKKFPSSISLWRDQIKALGTNDRNYLPLWMRTIQDNNIVELDYVPAVVICYCNPGTSYTIMQNIKNSGFSFSDINYDIDRFVINRVTGNLKDTFLIFRNDRTIST